MRLYRVHIDRVLYVLAEDALDAEHIAVHEAPNSDETEVHVEPAKPERVTSDGWDNYPPYGQPAHETQVKAGYLMKRQST